MGHSTEVSVPGKLILIGEHAVVYRRPAVVAAVNLRLRVSISDEGVDGVRIELPGIGVEETTGWTAILDYTSRARKRWRRFADRPSPESFAAVRGTDPAHVVKIALGEAAAACPVPPRGALRVAVESEIPIGSGFGSSAATGVGVLASYLAHRSVALEPERIDRLALEVERRQHGLPSGVDHATVLHGGVLWAVKDGADHVRLEPLPRSQALSRIRVYDSGAPAEPTGVVVAAVRRWMEQRPDRAERLLARMERAARALRDQLSRDREDPEDVVELIRDYERCLEKIGVVPEPLLPLIRRIEAEGGSAKISGAGSLAGPGAGGVLVYHPEPERVARWDFLEPLRPLGVRLGAEGMRQEARA